MRLLLALPLMACVALLPLPAGGQASVTVSIDAVDFAPAVIEVPVGTTVTWVHNDGGVGHNVSSPGNFRSPPMTGGERFAFTFASAGAYSYGCSLHPSLMVGLVRVTSAQPAPAATAPPAPPPSATALAPTTGASPSGGPVTTTGPFGPTAPSTESAVPSPSPTALSAAEPTRPLPTATAVAPEATAQAGPLAPSAEEAAQQDSSLTPLVLGGLAVAVTVAAVLAGGRKLLRR